MSEEKVESKNELMEELETSIEAYKGSAKVFVETHNITHTPQYNDKITEESLTEHIGFIRDNVAAASVATSQLAYQYAEEHKDPHQWRGLLDLPGVHTEFVVHPREGFHNPETGKDEFEYGHNDLILDFSLGERHTSLFEDLHKTDLARYESLFTSDEE